MKTVAAGMSNRPLLGVSWLKRSEKTSGILWLKMDEYSAAARRDARKNLCLQT